MADEVKTPAEEQEQYELIFRNGALANLKDLARTFGIPDPFIYRRAIMCHHGGWVDGAY